MKENLQEHVVKLEKNIDEKDSKIRKIEDDLKKFEEEAIMNDSIIESKNQELVEKETKIRELTMSITDLKSELTVINKHERDEETSICKFNSRQLWKIVKIGSF